MIAAIRLGIWVGVLCTVFSLSAQAVFVEDTLKDPAQETRAREISEGIRCLVCQNQSILDSNADLAKDLRQIVRERILAGDTDAEVKEFLVVRYGDWVLLDPPFKLSTLLLWLGPVLIFLLGVVTLIVFLRRRSGTEDTDQLTPLTLQEEVELDKVLHEDGDMSK